MAHTVLGQVALCYQALWSQLRQVRGVQLFIGVDDAAPVDARQLLSALEATWSAQAPALLLSIQSDQLLADVLDHAPVGSPLIEVHEAQLSDPRLAQRVHQAHQRGLQLVWRGAPGGRPSVPVAPCFVRTMLTLTADEALAGLRVSLRKHNESARPARVSSPVLPDQIYEAVASWVLTEHCLDEQGAWAVAGWPTEDVLHGYRQQRIQPGHRAIADLLEAIDADASMDHIEQLLSAEPILAYRFLRYTNSAGLGLRTEIESLRRGLMVLGFSLLRTWLLGQLPHATSHLNLQPVRTTMVLRARLMTELLDAGGSDELRREVYLCGLLSQIDLMLGEPLAAALAHLPLSERITAAVVNQSGPYLPYLELAIAQESPDTQAIGALCDKHQLDIEAVNRALLRTLSQVRHHPTQGLLLNI
jgi:hypothetical protein